MSVNFGENMNVFWLMKINYEIKSNIRNQWGAVSGSQAKTGKGHL